MKHKDTKDTKSESCLGPAGRKHLFFVIVVLLTRDFWPSRADCVHVTIGTSCMMGIWRAVRAEK
jgi:hypothetical protein